jgi:hypothetical protein
LIRLAVFLASGAALVKLPNVVGFAKRAEFVMPDLIRHPEYPEVTGFRLPDRVRHRPRRNDTLKKFKILYNIVKFLFRLNWTIATSDGAGMKHHEILS